jgi:hypothetical protein
MSISWLYRIDQIAGLSSSRDEQKGTAYDLVDDTVSRANADD